MVETRKNPYAWLFVGGGVLLILAAVTWAMLNKPGVTCSDGNTRDYSNRNTGVCVSGAACLRWKMPRLPWTLKRRFSWMCGIVAPMPPVISLGQCSSLLLIYPPAWASWIQMHGSFLIAPDLLKNPAPVRPSY